MRKTIALFHKWGSTGCCGYSLLLCYTSSSALGILCAWLCCQCFEEEEEKSNIKLDMVWLLATQTVSIELALKNYYFYFMSVPTHSRVILGAHLRDIFILTASHLFPFLEYAVSTAQRLTQHLLCLSQVVLMRHSEWGRCMSGLSWLCETLVQRWGFHQQYGQVQCSQSLHRAWTVWLWHSAWWPVSTLDFGGQHLTKVVKHYDLSSCLSKAFCMCVCVLQSSPVSAACLSVCLRFLLPFLSSRFLSQQ